MRRTRPCEQRAASHVVQFMVIFLGMGSQSERAVKRAHRRHACGAGLRSARRQSSRVVTARDRAARARRPLQVGQVHRKTLHKLPSGSQCELPARPCDGSGV